MFIQEKKSRNFCAKNSFSGECFWQLLRKQTWKRHWVFTISFGLPCICAHFKIYNIQNDRYYVIRILRFSRQNSNLVINGQIWFFDNCPDFSGTKTGRDMGFHHRLRLTLNIVLFINLRSTNFEIVTHCWSY